MARLEDWGDRHGCVAFVLVFLGLPLVFGATMAGLLWLGVIGDDDEPTPAGPTIAECFAREYRDVIREIDGYLAQKPPNIEEARNLTYLAELGDLVQRRCGVDLIGG